MVFSELYQDEIINKSHLWQLNSTLVFCSWEQSAAEKHLPRKGLDQVDLSIYSADFSEFQCHFQFFLSNSFLHRSYRSVASVQKPP